MKVSELAYERVVTCDLCGRDFIVNQKFSRAKRCPECAISIRQGGEQEGFRHRTIIGRREKRVSKLDTLAMEARTYGLSYGQYVALKKQGCKIQPRQVNVKYVRSDWFDLIYATVAACKARAERRGA